ncbi:hypothetical protein [Kitasatospora sp. NRRL B-11411]|nr:hypothetical protein [Kitasatospora sp. NRRL B-11411]
MPLTVRPAAPADLPHLPALQLAAGSLFHTIDPADRVCLRRPVPLPYRP